jgi:hypothetical protein
LDVLLERAARRCAASGLPAGGFRDPKECTMKKFLMLHLIPPSMMAQTDRLSTAISALHHGVKCGQVAVSG